MDDDYDDYDEERPDRVRNALLTGLVALALIAVLIAIGTTIFVRSLGLDSAGPAGPVGAAEPSANPLPTKALSPRHPKSSPPSPSPSTTKQPKGARSGDIRLSATPLMVKPMERVNLTGTYGNKDNVGLQVQRWEAGGWVDFGVSTTVRVGTFETYVMTGRRGDNRFRVFDPGADNGSNPVLITVQ